MAIFFAHAYKVKFLCTRQFQNRITDSVYSLLKIQIERFGLSSMFRIMESSITCPATGSEFLFYGRARNITDIKGTEDVDIHWAEECELMTAEEWRIIDPTLRKDGSQHWLVFNPRFSTDFPYQRFVINPPEDTIVRQINYDENPFLSETMLKVIEGAKQEDPDEYAHVYLGVPLSDDARTVIQRKWIEAAIDAHIKLGIPAQGSKRLGFDVADDGNDKCAMVFARGFVVGWCDEWKAGEDELLKSCSKVYSESRARGASVTYDCIGVGASSGAKFNELNEANHTDIHHDGFNAGGKVVNPDREYTAGVTNADFFSNIKAQAWWLVADRFRNTWDAVTNGRTYPADQLISIASDMPYLAKLVTELSTPRRDFDANGRVKVESKKDLAKRDVPSPNIADAFIMAYAPAETKARGFFENF
jgi:phage terminase large subunit